VAVVEVVCALAMFTVWLAGVPKPDTVVKDTVCVPTETLPLSLANARYAPAWLAPGYVWVNA